MKRITTITWYIRFLLFYLIALGIPLSISAQENQLSIEEVTGEQGETISLPVFLDNESEIAGGQFCLSLPNGIGVNDVEIEESRADKHIIEYQYSENKLSILFYASPTTALKGNNGKLCNIQLSIPEDFAPGDYPINFTPEIKFASDAITEVPITKTTNGVIHVETKTIIYYEVQTEESPGGNVTGGGTYAEGEEAILTAVPDEGYEFIEWSNGISENPYHFKVFENITLSAKFSPKKYTLTYILDSEVYHSEKVAYGTAIVPLEVPEKDGFVFSGWDYVPATMPAHDVTITGTMTPTSINEIIEHKNVDVYSIQGYLLKYNVPINDWNLNLPKGIYIVNGKKKILLF